MRRRFWLYAIIAYLVIDLAIAIIATPRLIRVLTAELEASTTPDPGYTYITPWTPPPTIAPLPCSRFVHPDPLQCKGR